jgi:ketosteroid isomerase-like protein
MGNEEAEVEAATRRFYDAIETMITGGGADAIKEAWHHGDQVTSRHPIDHWSVGWDQIWPTWEISASLGRSDRGGGRVLSLHAYVYGDLAYATVSFQASPSWGGETIMCTNVLLKRAGVWKIVHHHADPSPAMHTAIERMFAEAPRTAI